MYSCADAGHQYRIKGHTTCAGSTTVQVTLDEPIQIATLTTDYFSLIPNPWSSVTHSTTATNGCAGIAMAAATVGQCLWFQTGGPAICKADGVTAPNLGERVTITTSAEQEIILQAAYTTPDIGFNFGIDHVAAKWCPVFLLIK